MVLLAWASVAQAGTRVLVLGRPEAYQSASEAVFPPSVVASNLSAILTGDSTVPQPVEVRCVDTAHTNSLLDGFKDYTLMSWFYWPNTRTNTLALLRDKWDYVVMMDDPYVLSAFPEYCLEGVLAISREARSAGSQPILVMPWSSTNTPLATFGEMAYRVGDGAGIPVAPAGYAWNAVGEALRDAGTRPTPRGAYVTAATVYSRLFDRNATNSTFVPDGASVADRDALANAAFATVRSEATNSHYSGVYRAPTHFVTPANKKRYIEVADFNSSTESGIANEWGAVFNSAGIQYYRYTAGYQSFPIIGHVIDFCQSRFSQRTFGADSHYGWLADTNYWSNHAAFDYMDDNGGKTMVFGMDRVMYPHPRPEQETGAASLPAAYMDQGGYFVPVRVLWARIRTAHPEFSWQPDGHHMDARFNRGIAVMMYTLLSGRCPVDDEPADKNSDAWQYWFCSKTGYEIAAQHGTLNGRIAGFKIRPRSATATSVTTVSNETLTVRFLYAPTATVSVAVSLDNTNAAIMDPGSLVFTPANYATPQTVSLRATPGASTSEVVTLNFDTHSADSVFDGLNDQWAYTVVRSSTQALSSVFLPALSVTLAEDTPAAVALGVAGAGPGNTVVVGPTHGAYSLTNSLYTPSTNYYGADSFACYVNTGGVLTVRSVALTITNSADGVVLTAPTNGAAYAAVAQIPLRVDGYWDGGRVDYYADGTLLLSASNSPWSGTWTNPVAGSYAVKAVAYDPSGVAVTSAVANLAVTNGGGVWWTTNSGSWGEGSNWLANVVPGSTDRVQFAGLPISGVVTVRLDGARSANRLVFGGTRYTQPNVLMGSDSIGTPALDPSGPQPGSWVVSDGSATQNVMTLTGSGATIEVRDLGAMPSPVAPGPGDYLVRMNASIETSGSLTKEGPGALRLAGTNRIDGGVVVNSAHSGVMVEHTGALGAGPVTLKEHTWLGCPDGYAAPVLISNNVVLAGTGLANYRIGPGMGANLTVSGSINGTNIAGSSALYLGGQGRDLWVLGETIPTTRVYNTLGAGTFTLAGDVMLGTRTLYLLGGWPCAGATTNRVLGGRITAGNLTYNYFSADGSSMTIIGGDAQLNLSGYMNYYFVWAAPLVIRDTAQVTAAGVLYGYTLTIRDQARVTSAGIYGANNDNNPSVAFLGGTSTVNYVQTSKVTFDGGVLVARVANNAFLDIPTGVTAYSFLINAGGLILDSAGRDIAIPRNLGHGAVTVDGGLVKSGAGTLTLGGTNTYNGPTVVKGGMVRRSQEASLPAGTALTVDGGGVIDLGGFPLRVVSFNGSGMVTNGELIITGSTTITNGGAVFTDNLTVTNGLQAAMSAPGPLMTVGGTATLGGTLVLNLSGSAVTTNFLVLVRAGAISNAFGAATLPSGWVLEYSPTEVRAVVAASYLECPSAVSATDGNFTDQVVVAWSPVPRAELYDLWRRLESPEYAGAEWIGTVTVTNFADTNVEPNRSHTYWVRAMNSMATSAVSAADTGFAFLPNTTNAVPLRETFEGYRTNALLVGRNGWYALDPTALAISEAAELITSLGTYAGHLPVRTNHARVAVLSDVITNRITGPAGTNTWLDMMLRTESLEDSSAWDSREVQCRFALETNGHLKAYCYYLTGMTNGGVEFVHSPVAPFSWARLSVQLDYRGAHPGCPGRGWFQCYLNGRLLTNAVALTRPDAGGVAGGSWLPMAVSNAARVNSLIWQGSSVLDDLVVDTAIPYGLAWTVHASAGPNGGVSPAGDTLVWNGSGLTVTIHPNPYYSVQTLLVDGLAQGMATQYVFVAVTNDHTLEAAFAANLATNGTPQWWLASHGHSNNWDLAALGDDDLDKMLNWEEYVAGTDPENGASVLVVSNLLSLAGGRVVLDWPSVEAHYYDVERSTNIGAGFVPVASNLSAVSPVNSYTDTVSSVSVMYYRIRVRQ